MADSILGAVTIENLPELSCFTNFNDFLQALVQHLGVQFPDIAEGVSVSITQPVNPSTIGIWVKIDAAGVFQGLYVFSGGSWVQIDLGGCLLPGVPQGTLLVCADGVTTPLNGGFHQIPVMTDNVLQLSGFEQPFDSNVQGGFSSLGSGSISSGTPSLTSTSVNTLVRNLSTVFTKNIAISVDCTWFGEITNGSTSPLNVHFEIEMAIDAGSFSGVAAISKPIFVPTNSLTAIDFQVTWNRTLALALATSGSTTIKLRGTATYTSGAGTYVINEVVMQLAVTEVNVL